MAKKFKKQDNFHPGHIFEYYKLKAFFENDPTIRVGEIDDEHQACDIFVDDEKKAALLDRTLQCKYLKVNVIYNGAEVISEEDIDYLCKDNPLYKCLMKMEGDNVKALMFAPVVVPVYTDNFFSPTGYDGYLPTTLAQDLFGEFNCQIDFRSDNCCEGCCETDCEECYCDEDDEEDWDCDVCELCEDDEDDEIEGFRLEVKHLPKNAGKILYDILSDIVEMCEDEEE